MLRSKKEVDRHVKEIFGKMKSDTDVDRNLKGYNIARLYFNIKEYGSAKRYLSEFLAVRKKSPEGFKLLGQIHEEMNEKGKALEAYKLSYEILNSQKDLVLKICDLYADVDEDVDVVLYWIEIGEKLYPQNTNIATLRHLVLTRNSCQSKEQLENMYLEEVKKNPQNVNFHLDLLNFYINWSTEKVEVLKVAYQYIVNVEKNEHFPYSFEWYLKSLELLQAYEKSVSAVLDKKFDILYLLIMDRVICTSLMNGITSKFDANYTQSDSLLHLSSFDVRINNALVKYGETPYMKHMICQNYLYFAWHLSNLGQNQKQAHFNNIPVMVGILLFLSLHEAEIEESEIVFENFRKALVHRKIRISQAGHILNYLAGTDKTRFINKARELASSKSTRQYICNMLFSHKFLNNGGYFITNEHFSTTLLRYPSNDLLFSCDKVCMSSCQHNLHLILWVLLQHSSKQEVCKKYDLLKSAVSDVLPFSTMINVSTAETLCKLDVFAFLEALLFCFVSNNGDDYKALCGRFPSQISTIATNEQNEWWNAVVSVSNNSGAQRLNKIQTVLQKGLASIRVIGSSCPPIPLIVYLAKFFGECAGNVQDFKLRTAIDSLEERAEHYWLQVIHYCQKIVQSSFVPMPKSKMFTLNKCGLSVEEASDFMRQGKLYLEERLISKGKRNEALQALGISFSTSINNKPHWQVAPSEVISEDDYKEQYEDGPSFIIGTQSDYGRQSSTPYKDHYTQRSRHQLEPKMSPENYGTQVKMLLEMQQKTVKALEDQNSQVKAQSEMIVKMSQSRVQDLKETMAYYRDMRQEGSNFDFSSLQNSIVSIENKIQNIQIEVRSIATEVSELRALHLDEKEEKRNKREDQSESQVPLDVNNSALPNVLNSYLNYYGRPPPVHGALLASGLFSGAVPPFAPPVSQPAATYPATSPGFKQQLSPALGYPNMKMAAQQMSSTTIPLPPTMGAGMPPMVVAPSTTPTHPFQIQMPPVVNPYHTPSALESPKFPEFATKDLLSDVPSPIVSAVKDVTQNKLSNLGISWNKESTYYETPKAALNANRMSLNPSMNRVNPLRIENEDSMEDVIPWESNKNVNKFQEQFGAKQVMPSSFMPVPSSSGKAVPSSSAITIQSSSAKTETISITPKPGDEQSSSISITPLSTLTSKSTEPSNSSVFSDFKIDSSSTSGSTFNLGFVSSASSASGPTKTTSSIFSNFTAAPIVTSTVGFNFGIKPDSSKDTTAPINTSKFLFNNPNLSVNVDDNDDSCENVEEYEPSIDFKPVINLPDLVEVKTGEENDEEMFSHRAKLYRFDREKKEFKERGLGDIKILKNSLNGMFRVVMRREQTHKVCANHVIMEDMNLKPMASSETAWVYNANDFADEEMKQEQLCVKFKTQEIANNFKEQFEDGIKKRSKMTPADTDKTETVAVKTLDVKSSDISVMPISTLVSTKETTAPAKSSIFGGFSIDSISTSGSNFTFGFGGSNMNDTSEPVKQTSSIFGNVTAVPNTIPNVGFRFGINPDSNNDTSTSANPSKLFFSDSNAAVNGDDSHDESVEEYEPSVDFKPVVSLPELVESKTGEENDEVIFSNRTKLYRFDKSKKEYKERGIGELKILKNSLTGKYRIVMRRDQTHKVCANHVFTKDMQLKLMESAENAWTYNANDFADEEMKAELLAVRFKTKQIANEFKLIFEAAVNDCDQIIKPANSNPSTPKTENNQIFQTPTTVNSSSVPASTSVFTKPLTPKTEKNKIFQTPTTVGSSSVPASTSVFTKPLTPTSQAASAQSTSTPFSTPSIFGGNYNSSKLTSSVFGGSNFITSPNVSAFASPSFGSSIFGGSVTPVITTSQLQQSSFSGIFSTPPVSISILGGTDSNKSTLNNSLINGANASIFSTPAVSSSIFGGSQSIKPSTGITPSFGANAAGAFKFNAHGSSLFGEQNIKTFSDLNSSENTSNVVVVTKAFIPKPLFGSAPNDNENADAVEEYEPTIDFKPVVEMPKLVEIKTGEENQEEMFCGRSKLYRFDVLSKQWKERGVGDIKILKDGIIGKVRVLMRRDKTHKICLNHIIAPDMKLSEYEFSANSWCWSAQDYSDEELKYETFAIRFKEELLAKKFKKEIDCAIEYTTNYKPTNKANLCETSSQGELDIIYEKRATPEQVAMARRLLLPDNFYLYEDLPNCSGCRGCLDDYSYISDEDDDEDDNSGLSEELDFLFKEECELYIKDDGVKWQKLSSGELVVSYNENIYCMYIRFYEGDECILQHEITTEMDYWCEDLSLVWDTHESINYKATFKYNMAVDELKKMFDEGREYAYEMATKLNEHHPEFYVDSWVGNSMDESQGKSFED